MELLIVLLTIVLLYGVFAGMDWVLPPVALSATLTTNIFNPGTTTGGTNCTSAPFDKLNVRIDHLHVVNKTAGTVTYSLWKGLTGANTAGTELFNAQPVTANNVDNQWDVGRFSTADFLVGGASAGTSLTLSATGIIDIGA